MASLRLSIVVLGAIGIVAAASASTTAAADPAFDRLETALPAGWSLLATGSEMMIRHDLPCYLTGVHHENAAPTETRSAVAAGGGPLVTIELRYRLEPRWTPQQLRAARAANDQIGGELRTLAAKYRIDQIHTSKGRPLPMTPDERSRLDAYEAARSRIAARLVVLPRCTLGESSVFDGEDTYAQLSLQVDPPEVMTQAHRIIELVKQHCR
jgi:hypothetical protein